MSEKDLGEIIEAIAALSEKYDAIAMDLLIYKMTHDAKHRSGNFKELSIWGEWARQLIVALIAAVLAMIGYNFVFGG